MGEVSRGQSGIGCTITHPQERTFQQCPDSQIWKVSTRFVMCYINYSQQLLQVNSTEPATAVTALVAEQVYRDACQWVSCNGFSLLPFQYIDNAMQHSTTHWSSNMQLKTVSNGLLQSCSESELAFFCTQLTLNLRNIACTTSQVGLPSSPADICEQIKNHFAKGSPEREKLNANTDC